MNNMKKFYSLLLIILMASSSAMAATITSTAAGGTWSAGSTWVGGVVPGPGDDVIIVPGATVTVAASVTVNSITFSNTAATARTLTVSTGATLTVTGAILLQNSATINTVAALAGAGAITCASVTVGGNVTAVTGNNLSNTLTSSIASLSVSGNISINGEDNGTAESNATFSLATGTVTVAGNVLLDSDTDDNDASAVFTMDLGSDNGVLNLTTAAIPFTLTGLGTETLNFGTAGNPVVNYSGAAQTVAPGTYRELVLSGSGSKTTTGVTVGAKLSLQGTATVGNAITYSTAILEYKGSAAQITSTNEFPAAFTQLDEVIIDNLNGVTLNAAKTSTTVLLTMANGTLDMANTNLSVGSLAGSGNLTHASGIAGARTLTVAGTASGTYSGSISNGTATSVSLIKSGTGTLTLSGVSSYSGATTISGGVLSINTMADAGTNSAIGTGLTTPAISITSGTATLRYTGSGHNSNRAITLTVDGPTLDASGTGILTLTGGVTGVFNLNLTGTGTGIQNGVIATGAGSTLAKAGAGTWELGGANTHTGGTSISAGVLRLTNIAALGAAGQALSMTGGTLDLSTDATVNAYNVTVNGTATIVSNRNTAGAGITHTLGTLSIGAGDQLNVTAGTNVSSGTAALTMGTVTLSASTPVFDIAAGANLTLGALTNNSAFTKQNSGQLTLNTASARTGGTVTLSAGTMKLGIVNALGTTGVPLALNGGILDLATDATVNAYNVTVNGNATIASNRATSGAAITHTLGTLSIGAGDQLNVTVGSNITSGTAGLIMGTTTFSAATPLFDIAIDANLTLGALAGNFAFTKQGNGLMILNTASGRNAGTVTINTGSIRLGNAAALGTAAVPVVLNAGSGLNLANNTTVNAHPVTVNGDASIFSNRATVGNGITHTLGTLSIGNSRLTVFYGDNVSDVTAGLTFGTTTLTAATPVFDAFAGGVTLTLGAVGGNFAFSKDGGGRLVLNTASARTAGTVTLIDGTMSLGATNALGTTGVPVVLNGGVFDLATATTVNAYNTTVGGNVIITPNKNAAGAGITHVLGTLSIGANTLSINQGGNVTSGTAAVQFGNLTMTGAPVLSPNTSNLIMAGTSTGSFKLTKSGAGILQKTTTAWTLGGDFEITAGIYDATTQNTTILGNWINNGVAYTGSGAAAVIFNGSAPQSIGGSTSTTFNNLTIDNTNGVSLGNNQTVNAAVTLTNGNLVIPTGNTLTIANGNAVGGSGFSAAKSIVTQVNTGTGAKGFVRVNNMAAAAYLLPVSDGTYYLPVTLTPTDIAANNTFSVCVFPGITEDGEPNGTPFSATQKNRCVDAVWTVNYNGPGSPTAASTTMKVDWPEALEGPFFSALGNNLIGIAHYGPSWGPCQATALTGDNTANTVSLNNITQFSPFGVGWIDPTGGVLAIKITYFNASKGNGFNTLNWQAACSSSQAVFELERSVDGINFININSITATQARCASPFSYNDVTAPAGTVFYRIKIIDVDGKATYSAIVKLSSQVKGIELSGISPNPVMNIAQVKVNTIQKDVVTLVVIAADGKVVYRNNIPVQPGSSVINVEIANLPTGVYMMKGVFANGQTNTVKFIKQ